MPSHRKLDHSSVPVSVRLKRTNTGQERSTQDNVTSYHKINTIELQRVMQRQTDITDMFIRNQRQLCLAQCDVPLFNGDPLEVTSFIRALEHAVASRADSSADKF